MACLSFLEATEVTFETQRAENLHLRAVIERWDNENSRMRAVIDRQDAEILGLQTRGDALSVQRTALRAQVDALKANLAQLREMYQDRDGDLAFEFERANKAEQDLEHWRERAEASEDAWLEHEHFQPGHTAAVNMAGGCPKQGWCDCPTDDFEYDGDGAQDMASELAIVRNVYAIRKTEHVLREGA